MVLTGETELEKLDPVLTLQLILYGHYDLYIDMLRLMVLNLCCNNGLNMD